MISPLQKIPLKRLLQQPVMFDANIFMVGIENRVSDNNCSFENMKHLYMIPLFESFDQIIIHEMVYNELDSDSKGLIDRYKGKNVSIVSEGGLYGILCTQLYLMIFRGTIEYYIPGAVQRTEGKYTVWLMPLSIK